MKRYIIFGFLFCFFFVAFVVSCNNKKSGNDEETIISGKTSILVDETLLPIVEDQLAVFESKYKAKIKLQPKSETECLIDLTTYKTKILILPRKLTVSEIAFFEQKNIKPQQTQFATDGLALIKNKKSNDTLINLVEINNFLNQKSSKIKGMVFDNPNSSSVNYFTKLANITKLPSKNIFSFKTNDEVLKYISQNDGYIGVVGINWMSQPTNESLKYLQNINILSVKSENSTEYVFPSQDNIAMQKYPLARDLYIINCQGYDGLGMGFASFLAGEVGQRIILKSGLVPFKTPGRKIRIITK